MPTGQKTDWANYIKNVQAEQQGVANWNSIFTSMLDTQYKLGSTELERASQKNIDSAYSNYLHNQMSLKYTDNLTEGYRQYAEDTIQNEYDAAIATEKQNLTANKATLYTKLAQNVAEQQATAEKNIDKTALSLVGYENDLLKYASTALTPDGDSFIDKYSKLFKVDDSGNVLGWSDIAKTKMFDRNFEDNTETLTDFGKEIYGVLLGTGFDDWALLNYNTEKYNDYIENGRGLFNQALFGQNINPYSGTVSDIMRTNYIELSVPNMSIVSNQSELKNPGEIFDKMLTYDDSKNSIAYEHMFDKNGVLRKETPVKHKSAGGATWYELAAGSKAHNTISEVDKVTKAAYKTGQLKVGDIIAVNGYLAYYKGKGKWAFTKDTSDTRSKLNITT